MPIAREHLYVVAPSALVDLALDAIRAWDGLRSIKFRNEQDAQRAATRAR